MRHWHRFGGADRALLLRRTKRQRGRGALTAGILTSRPPMISCLILMSRDGAPSSAALAPSSAACWGGIRRQTALSHLTKAAATQWATRAAAVGVAAAACGAL